MIDLAAALLLVAGGLFVFAGAVGLLRLPDFYSRLHATSKCDTLGLGLMVAGAALHAGISLISVKILLVVVFVALVNSTAAHAIGRAAFRSGLQCWTARGPAHD
jgi:multicomponent Na+:H+ antiporter subunit G